MRRGRLSLRKLLRHLERDDAVDPRTSTTRLGDWFVNLLIVPRQHLILAVSGVTLLPVLVPTAPYKTMIARFAQGAGQVLRALKIEEAKVRAEESAMRDYVVATTNDRGVLGSMNDFTWLLEGYLDERSLTEVTLQLAEARCGPIAMKSPREATLALFSTPTHRMVQH